MLSPFKQVTIYCVLLFIFSKFFFQNIVQISYFYSKQYLYSIGDDDEEEEEGGEEGEEGEEKMPTCGDYIMHFLTLFWKVIFATIPPAGKQYFNYT